MKRIIAVLAAIIALTLLPGPAGAMPYSGNRAIGAHLSPERHCLGDLTVYDVTLYNGSKRPHWYRAFEVQRGVKTSDRKWQVPRHSSIGLKFYVESGTHIWVTVTHRTEVIMHRRLRGICF